MYVYVCNYIMYQNIQVEGPIMSTLFMNFLKPSIQPTSKIHTVKTGRVFTVNSSILKVCHKAKYADRGGLCIVSRAFWQCPVGFGAGRGAVSSST